MYRDIATTFGGGDPYPVNRVDALSTVKLSHAFYRSDEETHWVGVDSDEQSHRLGRPNEDISDLYRTPKT